MKEFVWTIRYPIAVAIANALVGGYLWASFAYGEWASTLLRMFLIGWAGWLVARELKGGLLISAIVSTYVPLVDHVLIRGGEFLILHFLGSEQALASNPELSEHQSPYLMAFLGVLITYVVLFPVFACFGAIGWALGKRAGEEHEA